MTPGASLPPADSPYFAKVRRRGRRWEATVDTRETDRVWIMGRPSFRARTPDKALRKAQRWADRSWANRCTETEVDLA